MSDKIVLNYKTVDTKKILYDASVPIVRNNGKFILTKIWYQESRAVPPKPLFYQTEYLEILDVSQEGEIILNVDNVELFQKVDELSISTVKSQNIVKTNNMKSVKYRTIVSENETDNGAKQNVIKAEIAMKNIQFFIGDKNPLSFDDVKAHIEKGTKIKLIVEVEGILTDLKNNIIFTNIIPKQVLIHKLKPVSYNLTEYSFVDSNESDNSDDSDDNDDNSTEAESESDDSINADEFLKVIDNLSKTKKNK